MGWAAWPSSCSRNARPQKDNGERPGALLARRTRRGWRLMIFCARATRGLRMMRRSRQTVLLARRAPTIKRWSLDARSEEQSAYSFWGSRGIRRPSLGLMARLGVPVGGRVRKSRAVGDQSAPIPEERTSKLGRIICNLIRRAHSRINQATLEKEVRDWEDTRSGRPSSPPSRENRREVIVRRAQSRIDQVTLEEIK